MNEEKPSSPEGESNFKSQDENTTVPSTNEEISESALMEVHHHSHTPRKKFRHYFFEFFMLFLAVVCGFYAENLRERGVERHREHQYMALLQRDLRNDSLMLSNCINGNKRQLDFYDSLLVGIRSKDFTKRANNLYRYFIETIYYNQFGATDRAIQQLKNAGGLRLVESMAASDSITAYYEQVKSVQAQGETFMRWFDEYHRVAVNVFDYAQFDSLLYNPTRVQFAKQNMALMTTDENTLKQLYSKLFIIRFITVSYLEELDKLNLKLSNCRKFVQIVYRIK